MSTTLQGSGSVPRHADRRHPRQRVSSLQYIELGQENGGIVLNIGEGGLAITSAVPLTTLELPAIRFRLPGSTHWIEAAAEVAWTGASRKEAGIRFVQLKPDDQDRIKNWVASRIAPPASVTAAAPPAPETVPEPAKAAQATPPTAAEPPIASPASVAAAAPPAPETVPEPAKAALATPPTAAEPPIASPASVAAAAPPAPETVPEPAKAALATPPTAAEPPIAPSASVAAAALPIVEAVPEPAKAALASPPAASEPQTAPATPVTPVAAIPPPPVSPTSAPHIPEASAVGNSGAVPPAQIPIDNSPRGWAVLEYHGDYPQESFEEPVQRSSIWWKSLVLVAAVAIISFALGSTAGRNVWNHLTGQLSGQTGTDSAARTDTSANPVEPAPPPPRGAYNTTSDSSLQKSPSTTPNVPPSAETKMQAPQQENPSAAGENAAPEPAPSKNQTAFNNPPPSGAGHSSLRPGERTYGSERPPAPPAAIPHSPVMEPSTDTALTRNAPSAAETQPHASSPDPATPTSEPVEAPPPASSAHEFPGTAGTVEVISNPYPSPRVSMGILSQPRSRTNLQIGPVLSRVEPLYPLEAVRQRLEGTVKLHVIVGLTGAVDRVELKNGPILLANAARVAVQQWRYKPTLLRNVPVESEEDVTVVFRLSHPSNTSR